MRSLIITYVRQAVPGCCKRNATGLERLSRDDEWLVGDVCLLSGCRSCEECDLCAVQGIDVAIDRFSVVLWRAIKVSNSPIGGASEFSCPQESVDEEAQSAGFL